MRRLVYGPRLAASLCVLAIAVIAGGCGGSGKSSAASSGKGPILIGAAVPMTGPINPWGLYETRMAKLAVADINANGGVLGRKLTLSICDDKSKPEDNGRACATKLLDEGAAALLTPCDFDWSTPSMTVSQAAKIPSIAYCAGAPQFGPKGFGPYTFSTGMATPGEAAIGAEYAFNKKGWRKAYLLTDTTIDYDTTYTAAFKKRFEQLGGTVVGEDTFQNGDQSVDAQVTRVRTSSDQRSAPAPLRGRRHADPVEHRDGRRLLVERRTEAA
jgi:branched-chain amino acid transport system substrate-binding protein